MIKRNLRLRAATILCLAVLGCGPSYEVVDHVYDPDQSDLENLLGEWVCVDAVTAGKPAPDLVGGAIEFEKDLIYLKAQPRNNKWVQSGYVLETEQDPKRIVINATPHGAGIPRVWVELYRFEDGSLVISRTGDHEVPYSFDSTPETGYSLLTYKRVK